MAFFFRERYCKEKENYSRLNKIQAGQSYFHINRTSERYKLYHLNRTQPIATVMEDKHQWLYLQHVTLTHWPHWLDDEQPPDPMNQSDPLSWESSKSEPLQRRKHSTEKQRVGSKWPKEASGHNCLSSWSFQFPGSYLTLAALSPLGAKTVSSQ